MAGSKQHFIPQLLQRGFEASKSGKHSQVWVFRKGQAAYKSSTEGVAATRYFYSEPSLDQDALDNIITRYEKDVLAPAVEGLRIAPLGLVDPDVAASVVSHLSFRSAFVRGAFGEKAKKHLEHMSQAMASNESARAFLGIDSPSSDSRLNKTIDERLAEKTAMLPEVARRRLARMLKFRFREHFHADFEDMAPIFSKQKEAIAEATPSAIQKGYLQALAKEIVPHKRTERLKTLHWKIVAVSETSHVILPDCLALASDQADLSQLVPYALSDDDTLASVLMPISSSRLLIGSGADVVLDWETLNSTLAKSSLEFFISSRNDGDVAGVAQHIGHVVSNHSQQLVKKDAFNAPPPYPERRRLSAARLSPLVPIIEFLPKNLSNGAIETAMRKQLSTPELAPYLDHLRAVVIVQDVATTLAQLGVQLNDVGKQQVRFGTCQSSFTPQGFICDVFVPADFAQLMVGSEPEHVRTASTLVRHQLGRAAHMHFFARSVTPHEVQQQRSHLENILHRMAHLAASHYFGTRLSFPEEMSEAEFQMADAFQAQAMGSGLEALSQVRAQYLAEPDVDKLLFTLVALTETLLMTTASGGVLHQVDPTRWASGKCATVLDEAGLLSWFLLLSRDMESYFSTREMWTGVAELDFLATHAERILWGFGFYLSPAGNQIRVDVGNDEELAIVAKLVGGPKFPNPK